MNTYILSCSSIGTKLPMFSTQESVPRILIVDDNADAADTLALLFSISGWEAEVAYSGAEALRRGEYFRPQVVFFDIGMPIMDGCETARRMRALPWGAQVTFIAITAWSDETTRQRARQAGMVHHLVKPVSIECALDVIAGITG